MICIMVAFLFGSIVVLGFPEVKQDVWIAIILGTVMAAPLLICYGLILKLFPGKGLFDIIILLFGKTLGKIVIFIYTFYALHLGGLVIRAFSEFIKIEAMPETPQLVVQSFIVLLCIWMAKSGIETLGRVSLFVLPIILIITVFFFFVSLNAMDFKNLLPILTTDPKILFSTSLQAESLPFGELILLCALFSSYAPQKSPSKVLIISLVIAAVVMLMINLRCILILGVPSSAVYYFPMYESVGVLSIGDITGFQILSGMTITLAGVIKACVCAVVASMGFSKLFNHDDDIKPFSAPTALIMLVFAEISGHSIIEYLIVSKLYFFYTLLYQVILPLIILVTALIKVKILNSAPDSPKSD